MANLMSISSCVNIRKSRWCWDKR